MILKGNDVGESRIMGVNDLGRVPLVKIWP
jgi:hypothetical protein